MDKDEVSLFIKNLVSVSNLMKLNELAKLHGIKYDTLYQRLRRGWTLEDAISGKRDDKKQPTVKKETDSLVKNKLVIASISPDQARAIEKLAEETNTPSEELIGLAITYYLNSLPQNSTRRRKNIARDSNRFK
jgi:hypothetical protein